MNASFGISQIGLSGCVTTSEEEHSVAVVDGRRDEKDLNASNVDFFLRLGYMQMSMHSLFHLPPIDNNTIVLNYPMNDNRSTHVLLFSI